MLKPTPVPFLAKETLTGEGTRLLASGFRPPPFLLLHSQDGFQGFVADYSGATAFDFHELPFAPSLLLLKN